MLKVFDIIKLNSNNLISLGLVIFGFILGRVSAHKISKLQETHSMAQIALSKKEVSSQANSQQDSSKVKQTRLVKKFYNDNGKLAHSETKDTFYKTNSFLLAQNNFTEHFYTLNNLTTSQNKTTHYTSNWLVGISINPLNIYNNIQMQVGYRIIDNLYLTSSVNNKLAPTIGIIINF